MTSLPQSFRSFKLYKFYIMEDGTHPTKNPWCSCFRITATAALPFANGYETKIVEEVISVLQICPRAQASASRVSWESPNYDSWPKFLPRKQTVNLTSPTHGDLRLGPRQRSWMLRTDMASFWLTIETIQYIKVNFVIFITIIYLLLIKLY